jgi:transposase
MISLPHPVRVFLHTPSTDLRKGFDALSGLVSTAFDQDPTSGHLFLFVNRRRDRLKILYWDRGDALILSGIDLRSARQRKRYQQPRRKAEKMIGAPL